jgi:hypothetical protein
MYVKRNENDDQPYSIIFDLLPHREQTSHVPRDYRPYDDRMIDRKEGQLQR